MSKDAATTLNVPFAVFLVLVFSLGLMKPTIASPLGELTPTDIIFPIALLCWIAAVALGRERFRWHSAFTAFSLYLAALCISTLFSSDRDLSLRKLPGEIYLVLLAVIAADLITTTRRLRLTAIAWLTGALLPLAVGILGIFLFYLSPANSLLSEITYHYGAAPFGNFPRLDSTFVSPSMFCNYLIVTEVLLLMSARLDWVGKKLAVALSFVISVCAFFTVSITLGGFFLALGLWNWSASENRSLRQTSLVSGIGAAIVFLAVAPISLTSIANGSIEPSSRLLVWREAASTFAAHPIVGKGLGTAVANVTFQNSDGSFSLLTDAHDTFLSVGAQSGVIGLFGLVFVIVFVVRSRVPPSTPDQDLKRRGLLIAFGAAFLYAGLTASFEDARHLWILMGMMIGVSGFDEQTTAAYE